MRTSLLQGTVWHVNQNICVIKLVWSYRSFSHPHKQQMDSILQLDLWWFFSGLVQRRPKPRKLCRRTALASLANSIVIAVAPSTRMQFSANVRHKRHTSLMHICFSLNQRVYQDFSNSTSPWWFWSMSIATWDSNLKRWRKNFVRIHLRWCLSSWLEPDIRRLLSRSTIFLLHLGKTEPETQTAGHHVESLLSFLQPE